MLYLNKLLSKIEENPTIFKQLQIISILGLASTQIKDLKKCALENGYIEQSKQEYFLTSKGKEYLEKNPLVSWATKEFPIRPEINLEYLKLEKSSPVLTKAIRNFAKYLLEKTPLKEFSLEQALFDDIKKCNKLYSQMEAEILNGKRICMELFFEKYLNFGLTKSLISCILLTILTNNIERLAIYEKKLFQLNLDHLMFDRICACPQNFEIQKTEMADIYILKDISKIILNKKSDNILEITKGLYTNIKSLDKYTMQTQNLSKKTLRLRSVIISAKDPISLFERDIPKALGYKNLQECDRKFLNDLKTSLDELKYCVENLINNIRHFLFEAFSIITKEDLSERFLNIKEFLNEKELTVLLNTVVDIDVSEELWINRFATFVNKARVPKDWNDEDFANFKVKAKELALKFMALEATVGASEAAITEKFNIALNTLLDLSKNEQMILMRKFVNSLE